MKSEIKDYIINNFKDDNIDVIQDAINDSITTNDEVALPGLGIFFIMNWECSTNEEKENIVKKIYEQIKKG